ncbi:Transcription-associated protein 1 [Phytophthora citrophthora]|uniref:Transcription-associated protein 1 n=1 Tax=Phytophthora citrophthora TaxID=4793 RepID=A0AAD9GZQ0_9STRA|nr:Transcription-associated protein 1 [Phytophthora citrophthora]
MNKLVDGDPDAVLKELVDLYRRAEILHTPQLGRILEALFPVWKGLLQTKLPPQHRATTPNRCRKMLLQILNRLPSNEALRPYVAQLLQLLMEVLQKDNEDNALIALKTLFDLHRNYRPGLRNEVQPFLELVQLMYKNLQATMKKQFSGPPETHKSGSSVPAATMPTPAKATTPTAAEEEKKPSTSGNEAESAATTEPAQAGAPVSASVGKGNAGAVTATGPTSGAVENSAGIGTSAASSSATADAGSEAATDDPIWSNLESFKTISELPLIIMLLFQCYPSYIESYIPVLVPLMMSALALRAPDSAATTHPSRYLDFLDCQVKTLSFVTYLLRGCANLMRPFQEAICENTVKLLVACPKDAFVLRKDIFVAARHIISTDFRRGFYPQLELLMKDDVLVGKGRCSFYQIRPLAYSTLADMIHHVRDMLTLGQVSTIVDFYGKRIHDSTLPISIQTTSIRLLLNLVDISAKNEDADAWKGRNILSRILLIISGKFGTTLANLPMALATTLRNKSSGDRSDLLEGGAMDKIKQSSLLPKEVVQKSQYEKKLETLLLRYLRVLRPADSASEEEPSVRDIKSLLRTMILGIRAVIWCTANYRNPHAKDLSTVDANTTDGSGVTAGTTSPGVHRGLNVHALDAASSRSSGRGTEHVYPLTDDERLLIAKVLQNGLRCFILYTLSENTLSEEKQMLDHFAGAFTVLEAADFRDLFISNIELLYECILQDHAILTIPQHFLANSNVSCWFAEILLKFLITQMKDLSVEAEGDLPDTKRVDKVMAIENLQFEKMRPVSQAHRASIVLRLFKIVFGSVTLFKSNESALFPHLRTIIESCLKQATFTKHPDNYLLLLRALFRSISGGKYENFYKEVFPLLPGVLSALMRLQKHIGKPAMQEVLLELCLTIPARLSSLLQYLPSLMKSVVRAILSRGELAYLGLRTLEFWVDNLNPDFLYPIMTSQDRLLTEIIEALNTHLIPPPYPYGELAMRILGKIGGRNRQYLMDPLNLDYHEHSFTGLTFTFQWDEEGGSMDVDMGGDGVPVAHASKFPMKMDVLIAQATKVLRTYLRKTLAERNNINKADSRLADADDFEEGENVAKPSFLLEKDDKTLQLETETMGKIRGSILQHKRCAFMFVSRAAVVSLNANSYTVADQESVDTDTGDLGPQYVDPMQKVTVAGRVTWLVDIDVGMEARKVLEGMAGLLTVLSLNNSSRDQPDFAVLSSLHASTLYAATRGLSPGRHLATIKRIETLRQATYGTSNMTEANVTNDFYSFVQAVSVALSSSDQHIVDAAKEVVKFIVKTAIAQFDSPQLAVERGGALFNCMCEVFSHGCYDKGSWRQKLGGAIGLQLLVDLLEPQWCHENELTIIKALFFVLSDHPPEVSATVSTETGEALVNVVKTAWRVRSGYADQLDEDSKKKDFLSCVAFQDTEVFQMLVVEFLSPKAPTRQYAKQCISIIASLQETTVSAILYPYNQLISKQITGCNLRMLPSNTRTGYVDALAYALSLEPPIFSLTKEIMVFLQEVWRLISEDSQRDGVTMVGAESPSSAGGATTAIPGSGVSAQEYPFGLSQACELRIAAAKLLRAAFLAAPNELNQHPEYRNRFVGVFFRYLTGQPAELVQVAQNALTDVIQLNKQNKDVFLPKELLQQCLRPVLLNLADYRKLNLPLLEGLSRLLTLLSSCFNVTLGEKLLEHLKQWRDPDRIIKAGIWKRGEEPAVAAAIVDLFHLLPPNDAFLEPLINCVVDLEAVLPKYGSYGKMSSPYRIPLTRFLNRYASMAMSFFLKREHLCEVKYSSLFQQLIKLPEAAPLHAVIIGDGGAESVVEATFNAALKINAAGFGEVKAGAEMSSDAKMQAQIQLNAQKAAAQAVATAQAQGMTASAAEARGVQARAAYVVKAQAQVNAQQALKVQSQVQIQANAQKLHAQTLAAAQAQGLSLVQAQAKAQLASKDYITKAQSHISSTAMQTSLPNSAMNTLVTQQQAQQLQAQIQVNAQKVHAQALATAQAQGLKPMQAQEKAKQAQATYVHRANAQAQAKIARVQTQGLATSLALNNNSSTASGGPFASKAQQEALELHYQGLRLVRSISKLHPTWLASQTVIIDCLRKLWRSSARVQRLVAHDRLPIKFHLESKLLVKCMITYSRAKPEDVQVLLDMVSVFLHRTPFDFSFLQTFYREEVATKHSAANKRSLVRSFLRMLREPGATEELKVQAIQLLIMPVLTTSFEDLNVNNIDVMDLDTVMWMLREILASKEYPRDAMQSLRIELLKLGTLLIQHMSKYVTDHRKEVIKFAWNHLKAHDLTSKLWAYVNVCRFISVYDTPPKIVLQVYVALLRTHEMDARFLVRKAFDILLPALPSRLPSNEFIKAIKWTKKIAYEEGHVLGQLVHIWFLIVRHPALFYPFRGQFVPLMVNSLNRLAIPPSSTPDNRRLAVNIVDLVISWEQTRQDRLALRGSSSGPNVTSPVGELKRSPSTMSTATSEKSQDDHAAKKRKVLPTVDADVSDAKAVAIQASAKMPEDGRASLHVQVPTQPQTSGTGQLPGQVAASPSETSRVANAEDDFELSGAMVDLVINFAFRFALASADKQETSRLAKTCGELFDKALRLWPSASIRFSYFDKLIAVTAETVIRQQQQLQASMNAAAAAAGGTGQQVPIPAPPSTTVMPPFFVVPKGAPLSSLAILDAVLGILNSLITPEVVTSSKRSMPYVIQYAPRIMKLLEPCFDRQNIEIQANLTKFLCRMAELYPPSRAPQALILCKFYPWLREIINERLVNAALFQQDSGSLTGGSGVVPTKAKGKHAAQNAAGSKTDKQSGAGSNTTVGQGHASGKVQKDPSGINPLINHEAARMRLLFSQHPRVVVSPSSYPGEFTLKLLSGLADVTPDFVDHFAPALLKLAQRFTREHLLLSATSGKHGSNNGAAMGVESGQAVVDSFGRNRVMATPSLAILNEWNQMQTGRSNLAVNNIVRHAGKIRDAPGEKSMKKKDQPLGGEAANVKTGSALKKKMGTAVNQITARGALLGGNGKRPIELLVLCYALLAKCTFTTGEHRRLYTNLLVHCLEGSYNIPLLLQITKIAAKMVASTDARQQVLTTKDKMTLLNKMATFDRLNEISALPLNEEYYQLVLKLCDSSTGDVKHQLHLSPTPQSHSLTTHFMAGLLAPDPGTRDKFLQIFFAATGPGPVARLQLVLRQDWQACGTRYWPVIAIETLMAAVSTNTPPSVQTPSASSNAAAAKPPAYAEFLEKHGQVKSSELTLALRDLAHIDLELAKELWVNLFSASWRLLKEADQTQLASQLLKILASKYNKRDLNVPLEASTPRRTNVVQTLMKGIVSTSPRAPVMTPELVLHIASAYDVWSCAIRLCEFQVEKAGLSVESRLRWIEALSAIYKQLSEDDLRIGLSLENIAQPETRTALTLEALGCVHEAQEEYFRALSKAQSGRVSIEDVNLFELRLWEERWVGCAKQLCQWQLMNDFAKSTQNQELLLDCAWKRGDWASAKQLLLSPSMQSSAELGCPQTRLQRLYISILDADKRSAIDTLTSQTAELALHQWQGLPRILSHAHLPLMHLFHKFVEVKESIQMMEDIKSASAQHAALPNLKPSINTWRERLPNKWEPILLWDDILTWRSHMFQVVKTTFAWSDAQVLACMHDSPWSVIKLAHTARKQRLPDVCLGALAKLYSVPAMDVQDAFSKLREQVSICYESATEYSGGLSILNTTNLDYFNLRQKAEMFRLKALFLEAQGSLPEANQTFSHCLQICDSYGKGWLSWGHYCYRLFLVRKDLALASQTIACYLQAIHHRCNSARLMIARVLWLLNMDDRRGVLIQAFETHGKQLPIWIWIIWIPQLLMALGRPEAPQIRGLLRGLSAKFPQALYYTMRAFFLENRDNAMLANQQQQLAASSTGVSPSASATSPSARTYYRTKSGHVVGVPSSMSVAQIQEIPGLVGPPRPTPAAFNAAPGIILTLEAWTEKVRNNGGDEHSLKAEVGPVQYTEDLLNFLRRSHDSLTFEMECMLEEMITRFRPEPEEELLTAVHALLLKCYQLPRLTKAEPVPKMLRAALARVCRKLFVLLPHQKNEKHEAFVDEFKNAFERDFTPLEDDDTQEAGSATTLYEIMNRLKRWKNLLQLRVKKVGKRNAGKLYLEQCSRHLMELSSSNMEVPGQYVSDSEPIKDLHARIQHFESTVDVLLRNGFTQRRVAMGGSDGRSYYFLVQYAMTHITRTDERMMQMYLLLNRLLLRHKETKKRNTVFHVPKVIPLTPRVRLLEDNRDFVTLGEVYELDCHIENKDPDLPVELYRERISEAYAVAGAGHASTKQEEARIAQAKALAFREICNEHVPETLLAKYVHGISAHSDAYFQFRSEFTKHLALSSFLSYALFVGDRAPHRVLFSRRTGRVVSTELRPGYSSSGILEAATTMPFRLTRNLHSFMTRPGVQGPFSIGMTAAAEALMSEEDILSNQLCLFFRDDLLSWHASKTRLLSLDPQSSGRTSSPGGSSGPASPALTQRRVESQVQQRVEANVSLVLERIRGVSLKKENGGSSRGKNVQELLEIATSPERQREMYPTWYPWL